MFSGVEFMIKEYGWIILIPQEVINELERLSIPKEILSLMQDKMVEIITVPLAKELTWEPISGGEVYAINISHMAKDHQDYDYIVMTSDEKAQSLAFKYDVGYNDIVGFLKALNEIGYLSKKQVEMALGTLEKHDYALKPNVKQDILKNLA